MKKHSAKSLLFLFVLLTYGCDPHESTHLAGPSTKAAPTVAAAEAPDLTDVSNVTMFHDNESCFRVGGGGLGANVKYVAYEGLVPGTNEAGMCFDLYEKTDPAAAASATECFSWVVFDAVAVLTDSKGDLTLVYRKK